jgi:nucleoside-diphosphate-sugar epimerase
MAVMSNAPPVVTGATGFIGACLAERLIEGGHRPRLVVRNPARLRPSLRAQADVVVADLTNLDSLRDALRRAGDVFHCAANVSTWGAWDAYYRANVLGVQNLLAAIAEAGGLSGRLVHLSSMDVYGFQATPQAESAPATGGAFSYGKSKAMGEAQLRDGAARYGLSHVNLRPGNVIGPHAQFIKRLGDELRSGLMLKINHGRADFGFLYIDNLIDCMLWAAQAPAAEGQCFNVRDPAAITWNRFLSDMKDGVRGRALVLDLPFGVSDLAAAVMETPWRVLRIRGEPLLHRLLVRIFGRTCGHDITHLTAAGAPLGRIGYEEGMRSALAWYHADAAA